MMRSVISAGSISVENSTRVPPPEGVRVHVLNVLLRLNFPPRPTATIRYGRSTSTKVMSAQPKRWKGASMRKRAPAPRPTESTRVSRHCLR